MTWSVKTRRLCTIDLLKDGLCNTCLNLNIVNVLPRPSTLACTPYHNPQHLQRHVCSASGSRCVGPYAGHAPQAVSLASSASALSFLRERLNHRGSRFATAWKPRLRDWKTSHSLNSRSRRLDTSLDHPPCLLLLPLVLMPRHELELAGSMQEHPLPQRLLLRSKVQMTVLRFLHTKSCSLDRWTSTPD